MNRKEAKELMPIIKAFAEGKTIQYYDSLIDIADWEDCENPNFENLTYKFRIKPEPKYRPFANAEECWTEMLNHHPFGWVKYADKYISISAIDSNNEYEIDFDDYTFADGTPFGVKVEEQL